MIVWFSLFLTQIIFIFLFYPLIIIFNCKLFQFCNFIAHKFSCNYIQRRRHFIRRNLGRPPPPFSVALQDASFPTSPITFSSIRIDTRSCHPVIQTSCKSLRFTQMNQRLQRSHDRRCNMRNCFWKCLLFPFFIFQLPTTIYAIPGTNYSIVKGDPSRDTSRQLKYAKTVIDQTLSSNSIDIYPSIPTIPKAPPPGIRNDPICFIADTDSVNYIIDTGANRIILNDCSLISNLQITRDKIKGIGGKGIQMSGTGTHKLGLKSDNGHYDIIPNLPVVYVPSCPYNLIPPQLLIKHMKAIGYTITDFSHDDTTYAFKYRPP